MKLLLKIAGKENLHIDNDIPKSYIIHLILMYGFMLIRGKIRFAFTKYFSKKIFIGKKVKILANKKLILENNVRIHDNVYIDCLSKEGIRLGNNTIIGRNSRIECTGSISNIGKGISIDDGTTFGNNCYFGAAGGIKIGRDNICGQYIRFHSENHNYKDQNKLIKDQGVTHQGIKIGNNNWIGSGVVFLDGSEVGNGCVIAANAVVTGKFKDNVIIGGVPAKIIKIR